MPTPTIASYLIGQFPHESAPYLQELISGSRKNALTIYMTISDVTGFVFLTFCCCMSIESE